MERRIVGQTEVSIFNSFIYRPGTEIDLTQFGSDKLLYDHAAGFIDYDVEDKIAVLKAGGIYTMEFDDSPIIKNARNYSPDEQDGESKETDLSAVTSPGGVHCC